MVKTKLAYSTVHGIGLFSNQFIPKGTVVWKYHPVTCQQFSSKDFLSFCEQAPLVAIINFLNYSYIKNKNIYYVSDNTRFINHSENANLILVDEQHEVAVRDIEAGEELFENYLLSYDANDFFNKIEDLDFLDKETVLNRLRGLFADDQNIG